MYPTICMKTQGLMQNSGNSGELHIAEFKMLIGLRRDGHRAPKKVSANATILLKTNEEKMLVAGKPTIFMKTKEVIISIPRCF